MKSRILYHAKIAGIFLLAAAALSLGSAVVSINCHNAMSSDKIAFFDIESRSGQTVIIILGKEFIL